MINFSSLFSFSQKEIKQAFNKAKFKNKINGLKLLQLSSEELDEKPSLGKILIVIPGKTGNAIKRNKIRRQIKAIFYEEKLFEKPLISILLVYKPALKLNFEQVKEFLVKSFES